MDDPTNQLIQPKPSINNHSTIQHHPNNIRMEKHFTYTNQKTKIIVIKGVIGELLDKLNGYSSLLTVNLTDINSTASKKGAIDDRSQIHMTNKHCQVKH